ncbi:MAG: hypothetical protein R2747_24780 [Pyrinomonadaceae bacterium]
MKVSFKDFGANVPVKQKYECGVDYLWHDFDLAFEDAFYLVEKLKNNHSSVIVFTLWAAVDFYFFNDALHVQIDTATGFWHESSLDLPVAKEILKVAWAGCEHFGSQIPGTVREWDAYCI